MTEMAGSVLLKLLLSLGVMVVRGQRAEKGPCFSRTVHPGDVLVVCPLEVDINQTQHSAAVVPSHQESERVLVCGWNGERCPRCSSDYEAQPLGDVTDILIVRVPGDKSQNGWSYKYQLVPPPDRKDPYMPCHVIMTKTGPQVPIEVIQKTTTEAIMKTTTEAITSTAPVGADAEGQDSGDMSDSWRLIVIAFVASTLVSMIVMGIFTFFIFKAIKRTIEKSANGKSNNAAALL